MRRRHWPQTRLFFNTTADLGKVVPRDITGNLQDRPEVDVAFFGIVCTDISPYTTTPKSEREDGNTGQALSGFFAYLRACSLRERPRAIILECVARLAHVRQVNSDMQRGTEYIKGELATLGYQGRWDILTPREFWLPQSRPRVYGLFFKATDLSEKGLKERSMDVTAASQLIGRMKGRLGVIISHATYHSRSL